MFVALLILAFVLWLVGFVVLWKIPVCQKSKQAFPYPDLSIIIPCRNEAENIEKLLASIFNQTIPVHQVLVVDDHSEDNTAAMAKNMGATVIPSKPLPEKWLGKAWACQQGAEQATGTVLLFLDADTWLEPHGLSRIMTTFLTHPDILSISPYHHVPTWAEQGSAFFNLMQLAGMNAFTLLGKRLKPAGLFGPCVMIKKSDYEAVGGHGAVIGEVLENYSLGKSLITGGKRVHLVNGKGVLRVRMYPGGFKNLIDGWTKSFNAGADQTPPFLFTLISFWLTGMITTTVGTLLFLCNVVNKGWLILYGLYAIQLYMQFRCLGTFKALISLFFPLPLLFFLTVFTRAARMKKQGKKITWKGRVLNG